MKLDLERFAKEAFEETSKAKDHKELESLRVKYFGRRQGILPKMSQSIPNLPLNERKGVGTKLLKALEKELKIFGLKELRVDTLAESAESYHYRKTRMFYKKRGFEVEKIKKIKSKDTGKISELATLVKNL